MLTDMGKPSAKRQLARRAWQLIFDLLMRTAPQRTRLLGERGLTPNDARGLSSLDLQEGRTMGSLANLWACDASNATFIVDRLERMGLAERRTVAEDRRVKLVALTRKGLKVRSELMEQFYRPPAELLALNTRQLEILRQILRRVVKESGPGNDAQHADEGHGHSGQK